MKGKIRDRSSSKGSTKAKGLPRFRRVVEWPYFKYRGKLYAVQMPDETTEDFFEKIRKKNN